MENLKKICSRCFKKVKHNEKCSCYKQSNRVEKALAPEDGSAFYRTSKWRKLRLKIIARDGHYCMRCFHKYGIINGERLQVHHIKSRLHYPELEYEETNLITVCGTCNNQLGTKDKLDFVYNIKEDTKDFCIY